MGDFFYSGKCNPDLDSIFQCKNPVIGEYIFRHLSQAIRKIAICDVFMTRGMYKSSSSDVVVIEEKILPAGV